MLELRKAAGDGRPELVTVYLAARRRQPLPDPGKINFVDVTVNPGTDTVQVRAVFPNPDRILVDGQLVDGGGRSRQGENALLVPQQALQIDQAGAFVLVVDKDNKVQVRRVEIGAPRGTDMIVPKGLERRRTRRHRGHPEGAPGPGRAADRSQAAGA